MKRTGSLAAILRPPPWPPGIVPVVSVRATTDALIFVNWDAPVVGQTPTSYDVSIVPNLGLDLADCANLSGQRTSCVISNAGLGRSY